MNISSSGQPTMGYPQAWEFGGVLTIPRHKKKLACYKMLNRATELQLLAFQGLLSI